MLNVWIFQTGEPLHSDPGIPRPMRAMNLANMLISRGHRVTIWSSSFYHQKKQHRSEHYKRLQLADGLEIKLIPSPGYVKNIGIARLVDHAILAARLAQVLKAEQPELPDVAFVGYPPIETAAVLARWLKKRKVPFIVDIKDQWPSIFLGQFPFFLRSLARVAFSPYFYLGRRALKEANALSAVTATFLQWSQDFAVRDACSYDIVVPLTTPKPEIERGHSTKAIRSWAELGLNLADEQALFCFVGNLSSIYDFCPIIEVARRMKQEDLRARFVICGEGGEKLAIKKLSRELDNVSFPGWISKTEIRDLFAHTTATLAPYRNWNNFKQNIPNKIIDSLAHGLPVLTSLEGEVKCLVEETQSGLCYEDADTLYHHCLSLMNDAERLRKMKKQAHACYDDRFDYQTVYGNLASTLELLASQEGGQSN